MLDGIKEVLNKRPSRFSQDEIKKIINEYKAVKLLGDKGWKIQLKKPEMMTFDKNIEYIWVLETNKGQIRLRLMPDVAPMHVTSTIFLTKKGFYEGITFHRVIPGFMAQAGCPFGTGTGDPGYSYDGEFNPNVKHNRPYLLSTANSGPGTDGSQFFITFSATPHLDGKHTIFGEVVTGHDVVKKLETAGSPNGTPKEPLIINRATIDERATN
ncbi:MAG: peptidylprolyl isomerase [Desulfatiglans sp.]|nr:peptidylprolyl isomerase [Desulfatiglans sp.]